MILSRRLRNSGLKVFSIAFLEGAFGVLSPNPIVVELEVKLQQQKVVISVTDSAKSWLAKKGYDPVFGARPMARTIQREIETVLADEVLFGKLENGGEVSIGLKKDKLTFKFS